MLISSEIVLTKPAASYLDLPEMEFVKKVDTSHRCGFVAIVGDANSGKSTLLNALVGQKVSMISAKPQTTRNCIRAIKSTDDYQIVFLDTPGFVVAAPGNELNRMLTREAVGALLDVDAVTLVIDASRRKGFSERLKALRKLFEKERQKMPEVVVLSKIDKIDKEQLLKLIAEVDTIFRESEEVGTEVVPVSALKNQNVSILEDTLQRVLPEGPAFFPRETTTDQGERFYVAEIIREKLFHKLEQELPYSVAVSVEQWEDEDGLQRLGAVIYVERDSQKGIVIGKRGSMLKQIGEASRIEIEKWLGCKVFLSMHVKVEKEWTRSRRGLMRTGHEETLG